MQRFLRLCAFTIFSIVVGANAASAVTCAAGKYLPANSETCTNCSGFYYCPGGTFTPGDTEQGRTPCPAKNTRVLSEITVNGFQMPVSNSSNYSINGAKAVTSCIVSYTLVSNTVGTLYLRSYYNPTTDKYDATNINWRGWHVVKPGYYLYSPNSCGSYAYYYNAARCPAGYYCPGKNLVSCNSSNRATVHTTTFGREECPAYKPNSPVGSTSINDCYGEPIKVATKQYVDTEFAPIQTALNETISTIHDVVDNTKTQASAIGTLTTTKQNRPNSECPAGWKCLLVKDVNGNDNWYRIIESLEQAAQLESAQE